MPTLSYPGVYVEEVSSGVRPIETASTSTPAFVGLAEMGPDAATRVTSWTEFLRFYGGFTTDGFLAHSVFQFFNNGGRQCYIVRVTRTDADTASVTVHNRATPPVAGITFSAKNKGAWGNSVFLQIDDSTTDPGNEFKISVRRQADPAVVPANSRDLPALETFDNLSMDPLSANYFVDVLKQSSILVDAQLLSANISAQRGFFRGGTAPVLPLGANVNFQINLDSDGLKTVALPAATGTATALADVATAIQTAVRALTKNKASTDAVAYSGFTCTVEGAGPTARLLFQSGTSVAVSSVRVQAAPANDATTVLKLTAADGARYEDGIAVRRPVKSDAIQIGDAGVTAPVTATNLGKDGTTAVTETMFSNAFPRLDTVTDFSLLAVPGEGTTTMMNFGMGYCANRPLRDVFYIGETNDHDDTPAEAEDFRRRLTAPNSYGALYFPWVKAPDPAGRSREPVLLPPSGYIAGLYARIDATRGVWKAPAGTEASINGVVGLAVDLTDTQHGNLNPLGVNVIRRFPASGVVSFGARTISSDAEWKYVPVRRTAIMLRVSIYYGIQWAIFEPNDEPLWSALRLNIGSFMTTLFRQGAFQGSTASQAFFVKCDAETTTQADIDLGIVNVLVGFAPLKPAEFVVVRISQKAGQASA